MTKFFAKGKEFPDIEKERRLCCHQISPPKTTTVNETNENLDKQTCNVQTSYREIDKVQKIRLLTNETSREKIQPKIINLLNHQLNKFQLLLLIKEPKLFITMTRNVFDIKSCIEILREILGN